MHLTVELSLKKVDVQTYRGKKIIMNARGFPSKFTFNFKSEIICGIGTFDM